MSFMTEVFADREAARRSEVKASWIRVLMGFLQYPGLRGLLLYRVGHGARRMTLRLQYRLFDPLIRFFSGSRISTDTEIGAGLSVPHPRSIIMGDRTKIGARVYILQADTFGASGKKKPDGQSRPHVGDDVLIGAGAGLVGPITTGNRVRVGANAVVTMDLPDDCTMVGNPGRVARAGERRIGLIE
ncbi:MAG TPA: DapH/DapD/GlmU-related protein [Phycisphaerae bacterium]|nr:DapH/DapD/GlmU-related protein [Phycisphaerae bacterium]